ncbi:MAG: prolyl oligopeptidase family serine peptidase [Candidatus Hydrogenedentes bacterium]|nr:prolyl oligopeptidase family serine peptidase [Candidatus Hydrogenedentota bacterium]
MIFIALLLLAAGDSPPPFYADKLNLLVVRNESGDEAPITSPVEWRTRREHLLANMQLVMGDMPDGAKRAPLDVRVEEEVETPAYSRKKISYAAESGDRVPAYLLIPSKIDGKAPAMLCLHQTIKIGKAEPAGLGENTNLDYAHELATRGYVCLAPDYPRFGDYDIDVYAMGYASATMKGIWNHMRGVDLLQGLPEVDADRIGCIGHSLGGHNTLFMSVFDERIKVAVTSCGFTRFAKYYDGDLTGWTHRGYMPRIDTVYGKDPARMPFDFPDILAAIAPRHLFINAPTGDSNFDVGGVRESVEAARKIFALHDADDQLVVEYPDSQHDFPPETRDRAYAFIDRALKHAP